ncbi:MAG: hypothetical protein VX438_09825 [Planctomycetota bacterium]|nr:hypothetical protein [Planctomycetota bacterium]
MYENLADAAGQTEGFNSKGLHDSINGGIQVCRKTGKLGCIQCFKEYAGDVYLAADDADLARYQCQAVVDHQGEWQSRGNRRWLAMMKLGWIEALQGDFDLAQERLQTSLELTDEKGVNVPLHAKFDVLIQLDAIRILKGLDPLLPKHEIYQQLPDFGESPIFHLLRDQNDALLAAMHKDFSAADNILSSWDRKLWGHGALHLWFENRLRLIAVKRISGETEAADRLVERLEEKAGESDDWLTIRRIEEIMGADSDPCLLGVQTRETGLACTDFHASLPDTKAASAKEPETVASPFAGEVPTLIKQLDSIVEKIQEAYREQSAEKANVIVEELLGFDVEQTVTKSDTCGVLNLMGMMISPTLVNRLDEIWKWANRLAAPFKENGVVLSLLATVGNELRLVGEDPEEGRITPARLEQLFRKSLELEKNGPQTYARAGAFFLEREDVGEAEKCYARGFKLDRQSGNIALKLAEIYEMTDRPRDAMHVLDLCLREGNESDAVAWEATMIAFNLRQFEAMLNYLNRYQEFVGEASPVNYYRAVANLKLNQPQLALDAICKEKELLENGDFHCSVIEYCARVALGEHRVTGALAEKCVNTSIRDLDYIPLDDIRYLMESLWESLRSERPESSLVEDVEQKLFATGLMPEKYFDELRSNREPQEGMHYYRVLIDQGLGENWPGHEGCLLGQESWKNYFCEWGVLALTDEEARERVLEMQARCYPGFAEVVDIHKDDDDYNDTPGIVWQGNRYSLPVDLGFDTNEDESEYGNGGDDFESGEFDDDYGDGSDDEF